MVHVVAFADLAGAAVATAVVRDDAKALVDEVQHLGVPVVAGQGPAVVEHQGLGRFRTPVLEENLHAVRGGDSAHGCRLRVGATGGAGAGTGTDSGKPRCRQSLSVALSTHPCLYVIKQL
ncbi:hypothetical protein D3C73_1270750 [compost metagenome]